MRSGLALLVLWNAFAWAKTDTHFTGRLEIARLPLNGWTLSLEVDADQCSPSRYEKNWECPLTLSARSEFQSLPKVELDRKIPRASDGRLSVNLVPSRLGAETGQSFVVTGAESLQIDLMPFVIAKDTSALLVDISWEEGFVRALYLPTPDLLKRIWLETSRDQRALQTRLYSGTFQAEEFVLTRLSFDSADPKYFEYQSYVWNATVAELQMLANRKRPPLFGIILGTFKTAHEARTFRQKQNCAEGVGDIVVGDPFSELAKGKYYWILLNPNAESLERKKAELQGCVPEPQVKSLPVREASHRSYRISS